MMKVRRKAGNFSRKSVFLLLCLMAATIGLIGPGGQKAEAASPLITTYKPQVVNADANVSYVDGNGNTVSGVIHHPGILMSLTDLDHMRDHVRAGDEPWSTAFDSYAGQSATSKTPRIYFQPDNDIFIHLRGPWAETVNGTYYSNPQDFAETRIQMDSETAFKQAIMWYITGDEVYRANAMEMIRNFASVQSCVQHSSFRLAVITYNFAAAAEIVRYSDTPTSNLKWTAADTTSLTNVMDMVAPTYNLHSFFMNQHQFVVLGGMGRAIFKNDLQLYAEAVEAATVNATGQQGGRNGSIKWQMRYMTKNEVTGAALAPSDYHVQLMEMGRDAGHSYDDVGGLSELAQTMLVQGTKVDPANGTISGAANAVNAFNFLDDRLLAGVTYLLKYHLGYDVLWTPAYSDGTAHYDQINAADRGRFDPFLSILYNYYKNVELRDMTQDKYKYLAAVVESRMPEYANKDYLTATLLFSADAAKTPVWSGATYKLQSVNSGKLAGISGNSTANGAYVVQQTDSGSDSQRWTITALGDGYYKIINANSGKAMNVPSGSTADGVKLIQWPYGDGANEQWQIVDLGDGSYKLIARHSGKALDVNGGSTADGANLIQWPYGGGANQKWRLIKQ